MKRPNPKEYFPKDFLNGNYEKDLEKYINYLEGIDSDKPIYCKLQPIEAVCNQCKIKNSCIHFNL